MTHGNETPARILQPRDRRLLEAIDKLRIVDRAQAERIAPFHSASRAKARLSALVGAGYLHCSFVGTIAGGRKAIYSIRPYPAKPRAALSVASPRTECFLSHRLTLNEVYLSFALAPTQAGTTLLRWEEFRTVLAPDAPVIPDAFLEAASPVGAFGAFVEVDLGTEALPVWDKKVKAYLAFARSADLSATIGHSTFRVLVLAPTAVRIDAIRRVIAGYTRKLFWLAELESINRESIASPIWLRPTGDDRHALFEKGNV